MACVLRTLLVTVNDVDHAVMAGSRTAESQKRPRHSGSVAAYILHVDPEKNVDCFRRRRDLALEDG